MLIGMSVAAGLGFGLVLGLSVALWLSHRAYIDLREDRNRVGMRG